MAFVNLYMEHGRGVFREIQFQPRQWGPEHSLEISITLSLRVGDGSGEQLLGSLVSISGSESLDPETRFTALFRFFEESLSALKGAVPEYFPAVLVQASESLRAVLLQTSQEL